ncbi:helix-turn-helix domain-containing protein [Flavobacterium aquidurense]|uniref:Helix-turn-helix domain-containing protein n=1 Tax=Flavobacterium aquidurense TaxID=362413 RepID=A0A0Q0Y480_9FLAO|nr:AraC family transcriptional regulator [Flavobacterium aquidurense]KQB43537.1 Helix-turn-helix domain-containing protein [Flavobacterium aquidurense]
MKIRSKILAHENSIIKIEIGDNYYSKNQLTAESINIKNSDSEIIKSSHLITQGMVILDTQMYFSTPQTIVFEIDEETVVMNFICCNNVEAHIDQLESEKYSKENTHNIFYTTNYKATFKIPAFEQINYLSIILSKDFYYQIINEDWELHEKFSKNILLKKSSYLTSKYLPFTPAIQWVIHEIKNCNRNGALKKMYIETKVKELLVHQLEAIINLPVQKDQIDEDDYNKLQQAKLILDEDYVHAPTLAELSRLISLNEFKLKKGFKACFGTTVKSYIIKLRMEHAKELFKSKASTVSEVAYKCGYKDVSHFSAAFKNFYGFSPQKFKINWDYINFWITGLLLLS